MRKIPLAGIAQGRRHKDVRIATVEPEIPSLDRTTLDRFTQPSNCALAKLRATVLYAVVRHDDVDIL